MTEVDGPHQGIRLAIRGAPLGEARAAMILLHGRGATAGDILDLAGALEEPRLTYLAPQTYGNAWYPESFLAPVERNEPWLSSALGVVRALLEELARAGVPAERTILGGFSQGACLALEFAARHARRYGGVAGLAGGLIGAPGTPRDDDGSLDGTPIFLGCGDRDPYVPLERFEETADLLSRLGAAVTERIYPGMAHGVNEDELDQVRRIVRAVLEEG